MCVTFSGSKNECESYVRSHKTDDYFLSVSYNDYFCEWQVNAWEVGENGVFY